MKNLAEKFCRYFSQKGFIKYPRGTISAYHLTRGETFGFWEYLQNNCKEAANQKCRRDLTGVLLDFIDN